MATDTVAKHTSITIPDPEPLDRHANVPASPSPSTGSEDPLHPFGHKHYSQRAPWLRAAVLGANDGLTSVASILIGVGAVKSNVKAMLISGLAALIAGALSMAAGEYVSVSSQKDTEKADLRAEIAEHSKGPEYVHKEKLELAQIYEDRGLSKALAWQVAEELSANDPIRAHARDELGIDMDDLSKPWQACITSALAFAAGAALPLLSAAFITDYITRVIVLIIASTFGFIAIGATGAWLGGAPLLRASLRVTIGGWFAMAVTFGILYGFGKALNENTHTL